MARRVHLPPGRIGPDRAELTPAARHYLREVLRLAPGDEVELFDGRGAAWAARIGPGFEALALSARREAAPGGPAIHLLLALAKGEKVDLVVQKATELGVARLVPFAAERSVVVLEPEKGAERASRWRRIAEEAARQCGRADVPEVVAPSTLAAALAGVPEGFRLVLLHGEGGVALPSLALEGAPGVAAVVGPEGGLTAAEREACLAAGACLASLGPRTLRAETAAIAAVALLQAAVGDLR